MSAFGCSVKFTAQPRQGDALVEHLLQAAAGVRSVGGCLLYLMNTSPTEPESVWVTDVWRSQEEHDASLTIEGAKAAISHVHLQPVKIDTLVLRVAFLPTDVPTSQYSHSNLVNHVLCSLKR